jgi:hypothetical protein
MCLTDNPGTLVSDEVESLLKQIVTQDESRLPSKDLPLQKMLKQAFDACMDTSLTNEAGLKPLKDLIDHIKDLMPTTSLGRDGSRRLKQTTVALRKVNGLDEVLVFLKRLGTNALIKLDAIVCPFLSRRLLLTHSSLIPSARTSRFWPCLQYWLLVCLHLTSIAMLLSSTNIEK